MAIEPTHRLWAESIEQIPDEHFTVDLEAFQRTRLERNLVVTPGGPAWTEQNRLALRL